MKRMMVDDVDFSVSDDEREDEKKTTTVILMMAMIMITMKVTAVSVALKRVMVELIIVMVAENNDFGVSENEGDMKAIKMT